MELIIERNELFRWLSKTQNISEKRSTMPILANALLKTEDRAIHIYATDLEVGLHGIITGEIKQPGAITFPSKMVFEIVRELPGLKISLKMMEQNQLHLKCGKSFYTIMTLAPDKYPSFPTFEDIEFISISSASFLDMIEKTSFAVAMENIRFNLSGVLLEKIENGKGERIRMVATDGHKLALIDKPVEKADLNLKINRKIIISRKGIHEMKRLLEELDSSVRIGFDEKSVVLKSHDTVLMARLVEGEFPEYQEVIPHTFKRTLQLNRKRFIEAIKRVSALSSDRSQVIRFLVDGNILKMVFSDPDIGEAEDEIEVTRYEGDPIEIGFNASYFLETCNVLSCDEILIKMNDPLNPGVVFPVEEETEYLCVVMPIKIV
jgi:DNA polymerase-3 subunit beta